MLFFEFSWNLRGYELPYYAIDVGNGTLELYNISDGLETTYCCTAFSSFHKYLHAEACKDIVIIGKHYNYYCYCC